MADNKFYKSGGVETPSGDDDVETPSGDDTEPDLDIDWSGGDMTEVPVPVEPDNTVEQ